MHKFHVAVYEISAILGKKYKERRDGSVEEGEEEELHQNRILYPTGIAERSPICEEAGIIGEAGLVNIERKNLTIGR